MRTKKIFKNILKGIKSTFCKETQKPDYTLVFDFELCKNKILKQNQEKIIAKLIPAIRKEYLKSQGLLISDEQARDTALLMFNTAKEVGDIDCMNNFVRRAI